MQSFELSYPLCSKIADQSARSIFPHEAMLSSHWDFENWSKTDFFPKLYLSTGAFQNV